MELAERFSFGFIALYKYLNPTIICSCLDPLCIHIFVSLHDMHESFHCSELSMLSQLVLCTEEMAAAGGRAVADGMRLGMNETIPFFIF